MTISHPDDETLSALLDGEADDAARVHVEGCEACAARLRHLGAASAAIAVAPSAPAAVREAAIRAALGTAVHEPGVRQLRREQRRQRQPAVTFGWVGLAAAILALLVAVPALLGGTGQSRKSSAATSPNFAASGTTVGPSGGVAAGPSQNSTGAATTQARPPLEGQANRTDAAADLGPQTDPAALTEQLRQIISLRAPPAATVEGGTTTPGALRCAAAAAGDTGAGGNATLDHGARLTWRGTPAEVFVFSSGASHFSGVMNESSCQLLQSLAV